MALRADDVYALLSSKLKGVASGLKSTKQNADGTITVTFNDGNSYTIQNIKGADGHTPTAEEITPIVEGVFDAHKSEFVGVTDLDGTTIYKGADNKIHAIGGGGGDVTRAEFEEVTEKGNLFYLTNSTSRKVNGVNVSVDENGYIHLSGTASANSWFMICGAVNAEANVEINKPYTVDRRLISGSASKNIVFRYHDEGISQFSGDALLLNTPYTFNKPTNVYITFDKGAVFTNAVFKLSLEQSRLSSIDEDWNTTAIDYRARKTTEKNIKILGIGNSYTRDCMRWLWKILRESGYTNITVGHGYIGAVTLEEQYGKLNSNSADYEYWKYNTYTPIKTSGKTLSQIITDEIWDVVIFQQQSDESGQYNSFVNASFDINDFITSVKNLIPNSALKIGLSMPYSHANGYVGDKFAQYYNSNPTTQLNAIKSVVPQVANHMSQCDFVINVADSVELGRANDYLKVLGTEMLQSDKNHLSYGIPQLLGSMTYACAICGIKPSDFVWYPTKTDDSNITTNTSAYLSHLAKLCAYNGTLKM